MLSFDCHFQFNTIVQTHGRDEEGAMQNIQKYMNEDLIHVAENIMCCGIDFDRENPTAKEIDNGWFELKLLWSGYWSIDGENEAEVRMSAVEFLDKQLTPFYQMLKIEAERHGKRFEFVELENEQITDVVEY